jgi:hypothetical protein
VHLNTYPLVVEAAMLGQGATLWWQPLLDRHLASGALVAMAREAVVTERGYALLESARGGRQSGGGAVPELAGGGVWGSGALCERSDGAGPRRLGVAQRRLLYRTAQPCPSP